MDYKFNNLLNDLRIGREIEFSYKNNNYSITHNTDQWEFSCDNIELFSTTDIEELIDLLKQYKINDEVLIKDIFNDSKFEKKSLYIL